MKRITIRVDWPRRIEATDSDGQRITITRDGGNRPDSELSDNDRCEIVSRLAGDSRDRHGICLWGAAFAHIQDMMNCSVLDRGWNARAA